MRFYYYATELEDGKWSLHSSLEQKPLVHASKEAALAAARSNCRKHWETHGTPCGIRLKSKAGDWIDELVVGDAGRSAPDQARPTRSKDRRQRG
jgi:tRNA U54 and U55 pseudouridine synthase Pus10